MEYSEHFEEILTTYIAGFATDKERAAVHAWLKENEANKRLFDELKDVYEVSGILKKDVGDTDRSWKRVKANYEQHKLNSKSFAGKKIVQYGFPS